MIEDLLKRAAKRGAAVAFSEAGYVWSDSDQAWRPRSATLGPVSFVTGDAMDRRIDELVRAGV